MRWTPADDAIVTENWGKIKIADIGKMLGVGKTAVACRAYRLGLPRLNSRFGGRPQKPREESSRVERRNGERDLWCAVIFQAFRDATMGRRSDMEDEADLAATREEARKWLVGHSRDFNLVCNLAGMDPDAIRDRAMVLQNKGWRLRGFHKQKFESVFAA